MTTENEMLSKIISHSEIMGDALSEVHGWAKLFNETGNKSLYLTKGMVLIKEIERLNRHQVTLNKLSDDLISFWEGTLNE